MIIHIDKKEQPLMRLKFYQDDVFRISFEKIQPLLGKMDAVSLFASAENLAWHLVSNEITDHIFVEYEWESIKMELEDEKDQFPLLFITYLKLCAMRKSHPLSVKVAKAIAPLCHQYKEFNKLLQELDQKEYLLRKEEKLGSLLDYELCSLQTDKPNQDQAKAVVKGIVDICLGLSASSIERILYPLVKINKQFDNAFDNDIERLTHDMVMKNKPNINNNFSPGSVSMNAGSTLTGNVEIKS